MHTATFGIGIPRIEKLPMTSIVCYFCLHTEVSKNSKRKTQMSLLTLTLCIYPKLKCKNI